MEVGLVVTIILLMFAVTILSSFLFAARVDLKGYKQTVADQSQQLNGRLSPMKRGQAKQCVRRIEASLETLDAQVDELKGHLG